MCPIEILPGVPSHISAKRNTLRQTELTTEPIVTDDRLYVVPADKDDTYIVKVDGYPHESGGMVITKRLTPTDKEDCIMITTPDDPLLGLTAITIDNILYEARKVNKE